MAYIVNTTETATAVAASYTVALGAHQSGDLLLVFLTMDGGAQAIGFASSTATVSSANDTIGYTGSDVWTNGDQIVFTGTTAPNGLTFNTVYYVRDLDTAANTFKVAATAGGAAIDITSTGTTVTVTQVSAGSNSSFNGWAILVQERSGTAVRHAIAYKAAASSAEANPTFVSQNDDWLGSCVVVRDVHASPFGSLVDGTDYNSTAYSSATSYASGALTTAVDGCLLFYSWGTDGIGATHHQSTLLSDSRCATKQSVNEICQTVSYRQQESAGAAPSVTMYRSNSSASTGIVLAVRNVANGALQPDVHPTYSVLRWYGNIGATHDATTTWQAPNSFATSIGTHLGNAINCSSTSPTTGTTSSGDDKANWGQGTSLASSQNASLAESASGAGIWVGGTHTIASTDMRGKFFGLQFQRNSNTTSDNVAGEQGIIVGFSDGTNWAAFQVQNKTNGWITFVPYAALIDLESATPFASSGTINWAAVTRVGYFCHRDRTSTASFNIVIKNAVLLETAALTGGGANRPATFADLVRGLTSWGGWLWAELQGSAQVLGKFSVQVGNGGTNTTYFDAAASSIEYPPAYGTTLFDQMKWNSGAGSATINIKGGASDTINFAAGVAATETQQGLSIDPAHSTSAATSFAQSFVGFNPVTWLTGVNVSGATFSECGEIDAKGSDWTDCTIKKTVSTDAAIAFSEDGGSMTRCTIDVTGTSAAYHLELGTAVTAITLADVTFTGTPGTDKVHVRKTTGTVTITTSGTTSLVAGDVTSEGATVSIVAPTVERGQNFTGLVSGSKVKVFTSGTQTVLYGTDNSSTSFAWDDATVGTITVDYTIQKAGYLPIRVTGVSLTGAVGTGQVDTPIQQVVDRAYAASSGLTYGTTAVVTVGTNPTTNPGTKTFQVTTATTGQNWYSFWIEQWIDKGDDGEALANVAFPIQANGPNSFTLLNGWEFSDGATSIAFLSRDGLRYVDSSGTRTAAWAAILTAGVPSGARVRFQQTDGGTTQSAAVTSGDMDQLVQVYGDAGHGGPFDYTGYLILKVQEMGYDQAEADVYATYGTLEDQLYVVGLAPTPNSVATGNPSLANPPTITDHAGSPVTWNSKSFSITITDSAAGNSGTDIMRWLRYSFETGGSFQSKDAFNWHDLVQQNGDDFKTVRGKIYGDTGASLKGVRVVTNGGTDPHPDFNLFTADDGTTYSPPPAATVTVGPFTSGSRVQLYDTANNAELFNDVVVGTSKVYSETYSVDRTVRVRITYVSGATAKEMIEAVVGSITSGNPDISYTANQVDDAVYNSNAVDGSSVTGITINDTTDKVEIAIAGGTVPWKDIYAYQVYWLNTAVGIQDDFAFIEAVDEANYLLTGFVIKNTSSPSVPLKITDGYGRDATTQDIADIMDTSGGSIFPAPNHVVSSVVTVGGVNVITGDIADVPSYVPTAAQISTQVWSDVPAVLDTNITQVAGVTVTGTGTEGNPWGPA